MKRTKSSSFDDLNLTKKGKDVWNVSSYNDRKGITILYNGRRGWCKKKAARIRKKDKRAFTACARGKYSYGKVVSIVVI